MSDTIREVERRMAEVGTPPDADTPLTADMANALYSGTRTHGVHNHGGIDCREFVVGECLLSAARSSPAPAGLDVERLRDAMYDADTGCSGIPGECCSPSTHADAAAIAAEYNRLVAKGARR